MARIRAHTVSRSAFVFGLGVLAANELYLYSVYSTDLAGNQSACTTISHFKDTEAPLFDGVISVEGVSEEALSVKWQEAQDKGPNGALKYTVCFGTQANECEAGGTKVSVGNSTATELGGLETATRYFIRVSVTDKAGNENKSSKELHAETFGKQGVIGQSQGATHSCLLMSDGRVFCRGGNMYGQLGDGTTAPSLEPVQVQGL